MAKDSQKHDDLDQNFQDDFPPRAPAGGAGGRRHSADRPGKGMGRGPGMPGIVMENQEFLRGPAARPLRILGEYLHPAAIFRDERVTDTITFFGSARIKPPADLLKPGDASDPASGGESAGSSPGVTSDFEQYYVESMEMARAVTAWSLENAEPLGRRVLVMTGGGPGIM
ncbi:MAG: hypothetical protein RIF32_21210, partial [Leptospirales bacterium]